MRSASPASTGFASKSSLDCASSREKTSSGATLTSNDHDDADKGSVRSNLLPAAGCAAFGPFRLRAAERTLEKDGVPLKIGSRAFDILAVLLNSAPELVSNRELMSCVWGSLVVDEGNLRLQIAALRKTLGDSTSGASYITNIPARGYCFTGTVEWASAAPAVCDYIAPPLAVHLPRRPRQIVGRDREVASLTNQLREQRFVSIVGAGGIGKTTVALAIAHEVLADFSGGIHFLDLTTIRDPQLFGSTLAARLGLTLVSQDAFPVLLGYFREQRALLVLDNCEHLIEAVARFAEALFLDAPEAHILATSRESLRAEGEWVYHLAALDCPPPDSVTLTAAQALTYPAVQLFAKQANASGYPFELDDESAPIVAELCRRLDGIALALELAACRVGVYGLQRIVSLLDDQFRLLWRGRRTALPRHQTLRAALDWSYNLLSEPEQRVFRHLATFVGGFSLEDAVAVAGDNLDAAEVTENIAALVDKSLVTLDPTVSMRYRLLDTTRSYARQQLDERGERMELARRHCEYLCRVLESFEGTAAIPYRPEAAAFFADHLGDAHAAEDWSFSTNGDPRLGVRLAAACAPLYFQLSLLPECVASTQRALKALDDTNRGTRLELNLQVCFGMPQLFMKGNAPARAAVDRSLELAVSLHDAPSELLILHGRFTAHTRTGDYRGLAEIVERFRAVAARIRDPLADALSNALAAIACHFGGDLTEVPRIANAALATPAHPSKLNAWSFNDAQDTGVRTVLAHSLWYLGQPDQALKTADETVRRAMDAGNPRAIAMVLGQVVFLYVWTGEWAKAEAMSVQLLTHVAKHQLATFAAIGLGCLGIHAFAHGDYARGTELLLRAHAELKAYDYGLRMRILGAALAEGYAKAGQHDLAYATACETLAWSEEHGPAIENVELLRIKGELLVSRSSAAGEDCLLESLQLARAQSLLSIELRIAMSLARLWADRGSFEQGLELLTAVHGRFTEGFGTRDMISATNLLAEIRSRAIGRR
jgi:predicted ATPase/DNA-binding winged helix-turn-helix (wHTH) protein